jgi:hypothetical protein
VHIISKPLHSSGLQLPFEEADSGPFNRRRGNKMFFNFLSFPQFSCDVDHVHSPFFIFLKIAIERRSVGTSDAMENCTFSQGDFNEKLQLRNSFAQKADEIDGKTIVSIVAPMTKRPILCATLLIIHNRTVARRCGEADKWPVRSPGAGRRTKFALLNFKYPV